jgi:integral membrane protein
MITSEVNVQGTWTFFKYMALIVGTVLLGLTGLLIYVRGFGNEKPELYEAAWTAHGWLFPVYVISTFALAQKLKWTLPKTVLVMIAGTVPLMSFIAERNVAREINVAKEVAEIP